MLLLQSVPVRKVTVSNVSQPQIQVGQPVSDASPLSGSIKGTMLTGKTYTISRRCYGKCRRYFIDSKRCYG